MECLKRKFWGKSTERYIQENDGQLSFDFGELKRSPEEEAAYKKAEAEAQAFREQRKQDVEKRQAKNNPPVSLSRSIFAVRLSNSIPSVTIPRSGNFFRSPSTR